MGHTKDNYYKLHGYPQNYTPGPRTNTKGKRIMASAHVAHTEELSIKEDASLTRYHA